LISVLLGCCLEAQPTLQQVWARHDQFVMSGSGKPVAIDPSQSHTFKGKHGQVVRGWDVGASDATPVLWWNGGPGDAADPGWDVNCFADPKRYRHLEIDQPGTGQSAWVPGWRPEDTVDDAATFLRSQGITKPILVTGWSWGSTMALLFAQRHPDLVQGVVVGGVWMNTPAEVEAYLGASGARSWMPGVLEAFRAFSGGKGTACDLHSAIRAGQGGKPLVQAYSDAESLQAGEGRIPREPLIAAIPPVQSRPVDLATETDDDVRFAYIESEMMCRGQRGQWSLHLRFPKRLAQVPLLVIQGRYDQICTPEVAKRVHRAWPGSKKLLVPFNGGHWGFKGPNKEARAQVGLNLSITDEEKWSKATALHFGNSRLLNGAAIDCLVAP
jgi:proline iminopeptidase